jgi:hypothetical protein
MEECSWPPIGNVPGRVSFLSVTTGEGSVSATYLLAAAGQRRTHPVRASIEVSTFRAGPGSILDKDALCWAVGLGAYYLPLSLWRYQGHVLTAVAQCLVG